MGNRPMSRDEYHAWYLSQVQRQDIPQYYIPQPQPPQPKKQAVKGKPKKRAVVKKSDVSIVAWVVLLFIVFLAIMVIKSKYEKDKLQYQPPPPKTDIQYKKK